MKYQITASCGHTVTVDIYGTASERERKVAWYEKNYICDECRNAENANGCEEVEMSYAEYKNSYSDCKTKKDSYNKKTKTIVVYVPVVEEAEETAESEEVEESEATEEAAASAIADVFAGISNLPAADRKEEARKMLSEKRTPQELAAWRAEITKCEPEESTRVMIRALDICEKYWYPKEIRNA